MKVVITISGSIPDDSSKEKCGWARAFARTWAILFKEYADNIGFNVDFYDEKEDNKSI